MNLSKIKPQLPLLVTPILCAATTAAVAVDKETADHVTVESGRPTVTVVGQTEMSGTFESISLHGDVNYSDLALNLPSNAKVFKQRVHDAAYEVCMRLYQMYPDSSGEDCTYRAERDAMPQVTAAINQAEIRHQAEMQQAEMLESAAR